MMISNEEANLLHMKYALASPLPLGKVGSKESEGGGAFPGRFAVGTSFAGFLLRHDLKDRDRETMMILWFVRVDFWFLPCPMMLFPHDIFFHVMFFDVMFWVMRKPKHTRDRESERQELGNMVDRNKYQVNLETGSDELGSTSENGLFLIPNLFF